MELASLSFSVSFSRTSDCGSHANIYNHRYAPPQAPRSIRVLVLHWYRVTVGITKTAREGDHTIVQEGGKRTDNAYKIYTIPVLLLSAPHM